MKRVPWLLVIPAVGGLFWLLFHHAPAEAAPFALPAPKAPATPRAVTLPVPIVTPAEAAAISAVQATHTDEDF